MPGNDLFHKSEKAILTRSKCNNNFTHNNCFEGKYLNQVGLHTTDRCELIFSCTAIKIPPTGSLNFK